MLTIAETKTSWKKLTLGDICEIRNGSTPSRGNPLFWLNGSIPWFTVDDIRDQGAQITTTTQHITDKAVKETSVKLLPANSVLICCTASIGEVAIARIPLTTNQQFNGLIPKDTSVLPDFLFYSMQEIGERIKRLASQTTIKYLSVGDLAKEQINIPPMDQQIAIAKILEQMDDAIMTTQKIIDQTSVLRLALLRKLFTQGIGHAEYRQTELGNLPSQWSTIKLDEVARRGSGHTPNKKKPEYYNGGIKWVSLADTNKFDNGIIDDTKYKISQLGIDNSSAVLHSKGTVLLSRDAGVGKSSVMNDDMAVSQHFMAWRCSEKLYNWYLYYYLQFKKKEFERIAVGSTIKTIGLPYFKDMLIPLPTIAEQRLIADTLLSVDQKIRFNKELKSGQERLKSGLIQDLLSGRVGI